MSVRYVYILEQPICTISLEDDHVFNLFVQILAGIEDDHVVSLLIQYSFHCQFSLLFETFLS